jgi:site-specific DNA-methyltransferase (adenine-specific)
MPAVLDAKIHHGDCLTTLIGLPDASVDAVITDPPYNSGGRTNAARAALSARAKYVSGDARHDLPDFGGDNRDQRAYTYWLTLVLADCHRVTVSGGTALVFTDWRQLPATSDALQAGGWTWRGIVTWHKPIARPQRNGFRRECEYVLWGSKGEPYRHPQPVYLPGMISASQPRGTGRRHITQKPVGLLRAAGTDRARRRNRARSVHRLRQHRRSSIGRGPPVHRDRADRRLPPDRERSPGRPASLIRPGRPKTAVCAAVRQAHAGIRGHASSPSTMCGMPDTVAGRFEPTSAVLLAGVCRPRLPGAQTANRGVQHHGARRPGHAGRRGARSRRDLSRLWLADLSRWTAVTG